MTIAIVDDFESDRLSLKQLLIQYSTINQLAIQTESFSSGETLLENYQPFKYTVIFLDIYMDGLSGIETAERIRTVDDDAVIIFLTTSDQHREEAFGVFAVAYLNKPVTEKAVFRVLDHILRIRTDRQKRFSFSFSRKTYSLRYSDIVSIETDGNYLVVTDRNNTRYRTRMSFSQVENRFDSRFLVLMKGILVNMDYISQIRDTQCHMQNGTVFPIKIKNAKEQKQLWLNYKFAAIREATNAAAIER